jgi:hypothetical protein
MYHVLWRNFRFDVYDFDAPWKDVSGVYVFSKFNYQIRLWEVLYVGETGSFRSRISPAHQQWQPALQMGATSVIAMTAPAALRMAVERALIAEFDPPLNKQLRPNLSDLLRLFFPSPGYELGQ